MIELAELLSTAARWEGQRTPFAWVILLSFRGSAPQEPGAFMLVPLHGSPIGTVGGGKIEAAAIRHARHCLSGAGPATETVVWNLQKDLGMTCGGEVTLWFNARHRRPWHVAIFGAGHVAQALVRTLLPLDVTLWCFDPRPEWLEQLPNHPCLRASAESDPDTALDQLPPGTAIVSLTRGHATDLPVLAAAFRRGHFPFIGCIGSQAKASTLRRELIQSGLAEATVSTLVCPIGLPLGNDTPPEIALSIAAQLLQIRDRPVPTNGGDPGERDVA
ncbi:MAG: xanthine dehydrogenase accessory protein XdhC [Candidatus Methylacidiphilales bacterium]